MRDLALPMKILAIVFWLGTASYSLPHDLSDLRSVSKPMHRDTPQDWGTPAYRVRTYISISQTIALLCLSLLPNQWLVSSSWSFTLAMAVAYFPAAFIIFNSWNGGVLILIVFITLLFYAPLPLSLFSSYRRSRRGERVTFA